MKVSKYTKLPSNLDRQSRCVFWWIRQTMKGGRHVWSPWANLRLCEPHTQLTAYMVSSPESSRTLLVSQFAPLQHLAQLYKFKALLAVFQNHDKHLVVLEASPRYCLIFILSVLNLASWRRTSGMSSRNSLTSLSCQQG